VRAFVAIEVADPAASGIPGISSRAPEHLTLRFLGEVDAARESEIAAAVGDAVASVAAFDLTLDGVGVFPSTRSPRVVWVGVTEGRATVLRLAGQVSSALSGVGFPPEAQPFVPHVTWFRVRSAHDRDRARRVLDGVESPPAARTLRVAEVVLKESILTPGGASHRTLARLPLLGAIEGPSRT
jgi:RNA 2',3'-cyclic 3'-phosphodiesterase